MEEWKISTIIGVVLIVLAVLFAAFKGMNIWIVLIIVLGAVDLILGLYRKKKGEL